MKEQIGFVRWWFSKLELWQWVLLASLFFNVGSLFAIGTKISSNMNLIGTVKDSWTRYKEQRNNLLTTIKDSDK